MITARIFAHEKCYPFITPDMMSPTSFSAMDLLIMP